MQLLPDRQQLRRTAQLQIYHGVQLYKTFAGKYRSTVRKINKKYRLNKLFTVKYEQKGVIKSRTFYKTSFKRRTTAFNGSCDIEPYSIADVSRTNLTDRLKAEKMRIVWGNGQADYAPCPQPQRPERERELETAHVSPKTQDHCVVSELPQAAASGKSLD